MRSVGSFFEFLVSSLLDKRRVNALVNNAVVSISPFKVLSNNTARSLIQLFDQFQLPYYFKFSISLHQVW